MNNRERNRLTAVLFVVLLLVGCVPAGPRALAPTESPTATQAPTATGTPAPTHTVHLPLLEASQRPTDTPQPTPTDTPPEPLRFAVIGDYGSGNANAADVAELVKGWDPAFILTTGDNNYPSGAAATIDENVGQFYHAYIHPYQGTYGEGAQTNRFFPTLGNHDWDTAGAAPYLDYFTLPGNERYYDLMWGPVHLFALDSDSREPDGVGASSTQALWLQDQLEASSAPWKIVFMHHPPYSSGLHGSVDWMRWPFEAWGADVVISGHDHTYERIVLDGFPYFINGVGGGAIYYFTTPVPGSQVRYNDDYGAMRVQATETTLQFEFINRSGELIDAYALSTNP